LLISMAVTLVTNRPMNCFRKTREIYVNRYYASFVWLRNLISYKNYTYVERKCYSGQYTDLKGKGKAPCGGPEARLHTTSAIDARG